MKRIVPLVLLVVAVAVLMFRDTGGGETAGPRFRAERVAAVELALKKRDLGGARRASEATGAMNDAEAAYARSLVATASGDFERALEEARVARRTAPRAWRPLSIEILALSSLGRDTEVAALIREALAASPDDERVLAMAAQHFAGSPTDRDPRRALELLEHIDDLPARRAPAGDLTAIDEQALLRVRYTVAMATGAYETALAAAREMAAASGDNPAALALEGEAARRAGDVAGAIDAYRRAADAAPGVRPWHENLVLLLLATPGAEKEALERTSKLLRAWPTERSVRVLRARALVRSEKLIADGPDRAVTIYRGLLKENPDDLEVLRNLAVLLYDWKQGGIDGDYLDDTYALLRRYVLCGGVIDDRLGSTWQALRDRAREAAASRGATELPQRAAFEADPGDAVAAEEYRGALLDAGRPEDAGLVVRRALEAAPDDPGVRALAARHFLAAGPDYDALAALRELDALAALPGAEQPLGEPLLWLRCRALLQARRFSEALSAAQQLLALRPSAVPYLESAARAALATGRAADAERWLRDALSIEDRPELRQLLERTRGTKKQ